MVIDFHTRFAEKRVFLGFFDGFFQANGPLSLMMISGT